MEEYRNRVIKLHAIYSMTISKFTSNISNISKFTSNISNFTSKTNSKEPQVKGFVLNRNGPSVEELLVDYWLTPGIVRLFVRREKGGNTRN